MDNRSVCLTDKVIKVAPGHEIASTVSGYTHTFTAPNSILLHWRELKMPVSPQWVSNRHALPFDIAPLLSFAKVVRW